MKSLTKLDMVQVAGVAGSILTVAATLLSTYASEKKLDQTINEKFAAEVAKQLGNINSIEG